MIDADAAYANISKIYSEFADFCKSAGNVSEADTRVKVIDRILIECLDWPESNIQREGHVHEGYFDYRLTESRKNKLIVEAKKESIPFTVPSSRNVRRRFNLSGCISTNTEMKVIIEQVQRYCVEIACKFAIVTNGYAWIVFRALNDDSPWRKGDCVIFSTAGDIKQNFIEFWNLLSFDAVIKGSLIDRFRTSIAVERGYYRPNQYLASADAPLLRNRFHAQLNPFIENIFRDIGYEGQSEITDKCYIYTTSLRDTDSAIKTAIEDSIPRFLSVSGGQNIVVTGSHDSGVLGRTIEHSVSKDTGTLLLLLGGIGSGKTTYIRRYINYVGKEFIDSKAFCFYITFLSPPQSSSEAETFIFTTVLDQIRRKYSTFRLETRDNLIQAYADEVSLFKEIYGIGQDSDQELSRKELDDRLAKLTDDKIDYVGRILRISQKYKRSCVLFIDNVDQLSSDYQSQIFLVAQRAAREMNAIVIVALREESYYAASIRKTFTAYTNHKFHIVSPSFTILIRKRLKYCREQLYLPEERMMVTLRAGLSFDKQKLLNFLSIIESSIFSKNHNIVRFIEALCFGNMREALDMFSMFMYSGNTNVDKMLSIFDRTGLYHVAFHEYAKAIILGDRKYYKDSESRVMNLFECSPTRNGSHLTSLRLLQILMNFQNASHPEGRGFTSINDIFNYFIDIFDNEDDLKIVINRLLLKQLVQIDTRGVELSEKASCIRITSAGWYYHEYLVRSFAYLDLVFQDTPFAEETIAKKEKEYILSVDRLTDNHDELPEKMDIRFGRVELFLDYLIEIEEKEVDFFELKNDRVFSKKILPGIREQYEKERDWIRKRISRRADDEIVEEDFMKPMDTPLFDMMDFPSEEGDDIKSATGPLFSQQPPKKQV